ncbi:MAG: metalloregulator ArsR/SmtB family transcription factor [Pseudomonadota bacterium]
MLDASETAFRALADPTRRAIVAMLAQSDMTVGAVAAEFDMSRPAVAKHLGQLEGSGLITVEARGRERINRLNPAALDPVADWLARIDRFWSDRLDRLKDAIERDDDDA